VSDVRDVRERGDGFQTATGRQIRPGRPLPPGRRSPPPAPPDRYRYSIGELEELTGVNRRTIRFYITKGLMPPAHGRGPSATYDRGHLLRLQAIKLRRDQGLQLATIKEELSHRADDEIAADLEIQTAPPEDRWRRIELHPNIELHVREPGGARDHRLERVVERIVRLAEFEIDDLERDA
jgi:DNA-binding transcriptional MerR regulator